MRSLHPRQRRAARTGARVLLGLVLIAGGGAALLDASSHREAPFITKQPKIDGTDFYMFRSYEAGREDFVTIIANYQPLQAPYGGPNYFTLDDEALYEIHIDNDGDAREDLTFQFRFEIERDDIALSIGPPGDERTVAVPLVNVGVIDSGDSPNQNVREFYTLDLVRGDRRKGNRSSIEDVDGNERFKKPADNIGTKSIPDYESYARDFLYDIDLPDCATNGRVFVGQRKDPFVVNLGEIFDLIHTNPLGPEDGESDLLADANVTSICLELPIAFLTGGEESIIGGWTTASARKVRVLEAKPGPGAGEEGDGDDDDDDGGSGETKPSKESGKWIQQSRLGSPLVNELVIGLEDKDRFNSSEPKDDAQFADYVTHPTLPALIEALFGVTAPTAIPRADLVQAFLTGVPGLNQPDGVEPAEMLRLDTGIDPVAKGSQSRLGVLGADLAGFPNGRRPGDDVVDIELRVAMGVLLPLGDAPDGQLAYTDGAFVDDSSFDATFPYVRTPLPGATD